MLIQLQSWQHLVAISEVWFNNTLHNYPIFQWHLQELGEYVLSTIALDFVYLTYILMFAVYLNVFIRLRLYFQCGYSI